MFSHKHCASCGKQFLVMKAYETEWAFQRYEHTVKKFYCCWKCMRKPELEGRIKI